MLAIQYLRSACIFFSWMKNEQTGSLFYQIDDRLGFIRGDGRATKAPATETVHIEKIGTDIFRTMHHDTTRARPVVKTSFHASDPQRQTVIPIISALRDIKTQRAFV